MRYLVMREEFKIAVEKANDVIKKLSYDGTGMVNTKDVCRVVGDLTNTEIKLGEVSFASLKGDLQDYGAMMRIEDIGNGKKKAYIILNSDKDAIFKRFSFVHELGHIATGKYNFDVTDNDKNYTISAHITYNISSIPEKDCMEEYMINEQIANIFALKVLMPEDIFLNKIRQLDSIKETADFFGITSEAVLSRMALEA